VVVVWLEGEVSNGLFAPAFFFFLSSFSSFYCFWTVFLIDSYDERFPFFEMYQSANLRQ
jgi:hypothetical protein